MTFLSDITRFSSSFLGGALVIFSANATFADVVSDRSLPNPTLVRRSANGTFRITQGTVSGSYLFHSFHDFSLSPRQTALFVNPQDIRGVIARVTGGNPSQINGLIQSLDSADIFFLNPNGIHFGSRAQLNVGGAFIATTAPAIKFDQSNLFRADSQGNPPPLLTISTPTGLQLGSQPAPITVSGSGHGLIIDPDTLEVVPVNRPTELLRTLPMQTIGLVGGDVLLEGGNLQASGGRIFIHALGANQSLSLKSDRLGWKAIVPKNQELHDILLDQSSSLITNGNGGGNIDLTGRFVDILGGSTLLGTSFGINSGQGINIYASEENVISGVLLNPRDQTPIFPSSVFSEVGLDQSSPGGSIKITAGLIEISEGAQVSTSTFGFGQGGNITLKTDQLIIDGGTDIFGPSGIYLDVIDEFTEGDGGNLQIWAQDLWISNGGLISASTFGPGSSGLIDINANHFELSGGAPGLGASAILAQGENLGSPTGIKIKSDRLNILGGAQLSSSTFGFGAGGSVDIQAKYLNLDGSSPSGSPGGIFSAVVRPDGGLPENLQREPDSVAKGGGPIIIRADQIVLQNGAEINSSTSFRGNAGSIDLTAQDLTIDDQNKLSTGIFATSDRHASGTGGNVVITAQNLTILNGGQVAVATRSPKASGSLMITAHRIDLQGSNQRARSGLFASALESSGEGGDIQVISDQLFIRDGATINVSNFPSLDAMIPAGTGAAGSTIINAKQLILDNQGSITASTVGGDRGNLTITSDLLALNQQSQITTDTTSSIGGNVDITTQQLFGLNNSDITANARQGRGGQVTITAEQVFGTEARSQLTPLSDITASSDLGTEFAGNVSVTILNPSPNEDQALRPKAIIDTSQLLAQSCFQKTATRQGRFVLKGSGGLASAPYSSTSSLFNTLDLDQPNSQYLQSSLRSLPLAHSTHFIQLRNGTVVLGKSC